jgi:hypothetical protein
MTYEFDTMAKLAEFFISKALRCEYLAKRAKTIKATEIENSAANAWRFAASVVAHSVINQHEAA